MGTIKGSKLTQKHKEAISDALKGKMPKNISMIAGWNKGKKMPKEFCDKISELTKKGICGMKGKSHSEVTKEKQRKSNKTKLLWQNPLYRKMMSDNHKGKMTGNKNPAYIDGRKPLVMQIRNSWKTEEWRKKVFKRDDYTCQDCKERGEKLEAHHKYPFSKIITDYCIKTIEQALKCKALWSIENGETLCKKCHKKISSRR